MTNKQKEMRIEHRKRLIWCNKLKQERQKAQEENNLEVEKNINAVLDDVRTCILCNYMCVDNKDYVKHTDTRAHQNKCLID